MQETLNKLDARPGITSKNNHPRNNARILKDDVSTRTRSKSSQVDQNAGITTRSSKISRYVWLSITLSKI